MKAKEHFKTVCKHKYWVGYYCFKAGIPWRGIKHDMSKFSPTEFIESVKYYQGTDSPINACKKDKGWSKAWQHHKGRNDHHYEFWTDDLDHGGKPLLMPYECALECICDFLGAGRAYNGDKFTYAGELAWWEKRIKNPLMMHPAIKAFITYELKLFAKLEAEGKEFEFNDTKYIYDICKNVYEQMGVN